jgi:PAS domain S-box-containing protein
MNDKDIIRHMAGALRYFTSSPEKVDFDFSIFQNAQSPELKELCEAFMSVANIHSTAFDAIRQMAIGNLEFQLPNDNAFYTPIKDLQSKLKHLVWQTHRLAEGDYNQSIDFLGDFSTSFNQLIQSLKDRQSIEKALEESKRQYDMIALHSRDVIWTLDLNTRRFTYMSPSVYTLRGLTIEEALNETMEESMTPESYQTVINLWQPTLERYQKNPETRWAISELQQPCKNGRIIDVEVSTSILPDEYGRPREVLGISRDITRRKEAEALLKQSEARLIKLLARQTQRNKKLSDQMQYFFDNTTNGIAFFDIEEEGAIRITKCNRRWAAASGHLPSDLEEAIIETVFDADTCQLYHTIINDALQKQITVQDYCQWRNLYLELVVIPIRNESNGLFRQCAVLVHNITDRIEAEQKIRESEIKFSNIFNNSSDAIVVITPQLKVLEVNRRFFEITGYDEPAEKPFQIEDIRKYIPARYIPIILKPLSLPENENRTVAFECEIIKQNGLLLPVEISSNCFIDNGQMVIEAMIRDVSTRKDLERQLTNVGIQIETRERRALAADLHDNVGPLLSSMNMYLSTLARKPDIKPHVELVGDIRNILKEAITSVREISNNISPQVLTNYGLTSALQLFFETKKQLINVNITNDLGDLRFDEIKEVMVYNIIKELYNNTIKYAGASRIDLQLCREGDKILLHYRDNGVGFDLEKKMIEPSSSLGLFSIINRIKNLDGAYKMDASPQKGFAIDIEFTI